MYYRIIVISILLLISIFTTAQKRKNVLFIAIDDMKPVIGAFGESQIKTPNIDKLAEKGVSFTNCHCQFAICGPSRASIMTGMRPDVTRVWDLSTKMRDKNPDIISIPEYFKYNGYETVGTGKIFDPRCVDNDRDIPSWSKIFVKEWNTPNSSQGDKKEYLYFYSNEENRAYAEELLAEAEKQGLTGGAAINYAHKFFKPATESADVSDEGYIDGRLTSQAIKFIDQYSNKEKPFFIAVGYKKPHLPFCAPQKYWDLYDSTKIQLAGYREYNNNGAPDLAFQNSNELRSYTDIPEDTILPESKQRELIHGYYAAVSYIDALIGKVIAKLEEENLMENTIIVLWGDHGFHLGDHGMWCKHTNFEHATRSPLIIYSPDNVGGTANSSPTEFVDLFPTLNELAGLQQLNYLDGTSLAPIIRGDKQQVNPAAFSQYNRNGHVKMGYTMRTNRYRYTEWIDKSWRTYNNYDASKVIGTELYDYVIDPLETENKVAKIEYKETIDSLQAILHVSFTNQIKGSGVLPEFLFIDYPIDAKSFVAAHGVDINGTSVTEFSDGDRIGYLINSNFKGEKELVINGIAILKQGEICIKFNGSRIGEYQVNSDSLVIPISLVKGKGFIEFESIDANFNFNSFKIRDVIEQSGIKKQNLRGIKLYPNPVKDVLKLDGIEFFDEIKVLTTNGKVIFHQKEFSKTVSLPKQMENGNYIVQILRDEKTHNFKITKV